MGVCDEKRAGDKKLPLGIGVSRIGLSAGPRISTRNGILCISNVEAEKGFLQAKSRTKPPHGFIIVLKPMLRITLQINRQARTADAPPGVTLLEFLRDYLSLTGTKAGCEEGVCGSCTVLIDGRAARACLLKAESQQGKSITTIEGLATSDGLHPVQKAFLAAEAYQCGYCTPGMIMEAAALLQNTADPTPAAVARQMQGHVCRCGMYNEIVQAVIAASREAKRG